MHKLLRIIDANLNRAQEGLRVCEDITRFILNEKGLTRYFKTIRQDVGTLAKKIYTGKALLLRSRNVKRDIGKKTTYREGKRSSIEDVFRANIQRAKESLRVLEEISKLLNKKISQDFKRIRFKVYEIEKKSRIKLEALLHHR